MTLYDTNYFMNQMRAGMLLNPGREVQHVSVPVVHQVVERVVEHKVTEKPREFDAEGFRRAAKAHLEVPEAGSLKVTMEVEDENRSIYLHFARKKLHELVYASLPKPVEPSSFEVALKEGLVSSLQLSKATLALALRNGSTTERYPVVHSALSSKFIDVGQELRAKVMDSVMREISCLDSMDYSASR